MLQEDEKKQDLPQDELEASQEETEAGKKKHRRLKEEHFIESKNKEKYKDFRKNMAQKGKHIYDKIRKDKFLGGVKGRRGG